jgi:16S rRNA G1207 methylase RsmC
MKRGIPCETCGFIPYQEGQRHDCEVLLARMRQPLPMHAEIRVVNETEGAFARAQRDIENTARLMRELAAARERRITMRYALLAWAAFLVLLLGLWASGTLWK